MSDDPREGFGPDDPTAPDRAHTDHSACTFTLKEYSGGDPWIVVEFYDPDLPALKHGDAFLGLQFREGVSFAEAQKFAAELNRVCGGMSQTKFDT